MGFSFTPEELDLVHARLAEEARVFVEGGVEMIEPDERLQQLVVSIIQRDPVDALRKRGYRALGIWSLADLANVINGRTRRPTSAAVLRIAAKLGLAALALIGAFAVRDRAARALVLSYPVYNTAVYALVGASQQRYSLPARPFLFIFMAAGAARLFSTLSRRR